MSAFLREIFIFDWIFKYNHQDERTKIRLDITYSYSETKRVEHNSTYERKRLIAIT